MTRTCPFCKKPIPRGRIRRGSVHAETDEMYAARATCGAKGCRYRHSSHTMRDTQIGRRSAISLSAGWPEVTGEVVADFRPHELRFAHEPALMVARPEREAFNYHGNSSASVAV